MKDKRQVTLLFTKVKVVEVKVKYFVCDHFSSAVTSNRKFLLHFNVRYQHEMGPIDVGVYGCIFKVTEYTFWDVLYPLQDVHMCIYGIHFCLVCCIQVGVTTW